MNEDCKDFWKEQIERTIQKKKVKEEVNYKKVIEERKKEEEQRKKSDGEIYKEARSRSGESSTSIGGE